MKAHDLNGRDGGRTKARGGGRISGGRIPHDQAWKAMFRCAPMMRSLILDFVEPELVAELDLSGSELRPGEFVTADAPA